MKGYDNMDIDEQTEKKSVTLYKCSNCTTSFCSFAAEVITKCPICHGSNLEANKIDEERELYYIPFQMTKKQAFKDYRRKTFWDPFIPFAFKTKKIDFLHKIYIPAFLLDAKQEGNITFLGGEKVPTENSKKKFVTKKYNVDNKVLLVLPVFPPEPLPLISINTMIIIMISVPEPPPTLAALPPAELALRPA